MKTLYLHPRDITWETKVSGIRIDLKDKAFVLESFDEIIIHDDYSKARIQLNKNHDMFSSVIFATDPLNDPGYYAYII